MVEPVYRQTIVVPPEAIDGQGRVNNVVYVQWMQDVAIAHADASGCTAALAGSGFGWVVRSHRIEYLAPALAGDRVELCTWVVDFRRVRSLRRYSFRRQTDDVVLARGETDWVFMHEQSGRPSAIPVEVQGCFTLSEGPGAAST